MARPLWSSPPILAIFAPLRPRRLARLAQLPEKRDASSKHLKLQAFPGSSWVILMDHPGSPRKSLKGCPGGGTERGKGRGQIPSVTKCPRGTARAPQLEPSSGFGAIHAVTRATNNEYHDDPTSPCSSAARATSVGRDTIQQACGSSIDSWVTCIPPP